MGDDPLDEIMGYLGLGDRPLPAAPTERTSDSLPDECHLATREALTLWRAENGSAEWIEVRGPIPTLRATRPKANLLLSLQPVLNAWISGARPSANEDQLRIRTVKHHGDLKLEVRYRTWKPLRLCRKQARAILLFAAEIEAFTAS